MKKPSTWTSFPIPSATELRQFLENDSLTDIALSEELWNVSSGAPGLLKARQAGTASFNRPRGQGDYVYDPIRRRYTREGKRSLTEAQLRIQVARASIEARRRMRIETQQLIAGAILFSVWYFRMRSMMKALYRSIFTVWLGGEIFYDQNERNAFYLFTLIQFTRLDIFARQLDSGETAFNGRIIGRAGMYGDWGKAEYQNLRLERAKTEDVTDGMLFTPEKIATTIEGMPKKKKKPTQGRRVLGHNENHCRNSLTRPGCVEMAELGWMPIKQIVPIGEGTCLSSCNCHLEFK